MRALSSAYGPRGDDGPMAGFAVRLRAPGAETRVCAPPHLADLPRRAAGLVAGGVATVSFAVSAAVIAGLVTAVAAVAVAWATGFLKPSAEAAPEPA